MIKHTSQHSASAIITILFCVIFIFSPLLLIAPVLLIKLNKLKESFKIFIISDTKKCPKKLTLSHPTTKISKKSYVPQLPITKVSPTKNSHHPPKPSQYKNLSFHNQSLMIHSPLNSNNLNNFTNEKLNMKRNSNKCMLKVSSKKKTLSQKIEHKKKRKSIKMNSKRSKSMKPASSETIKETCSL